jgi:hypothetical protein
MFVLLLVPAVIVTALDLSHEFEPLQRRDEDEGDENGLSGPTNLQLITTDQMRFHALGFVQRQNHDFKSNLKMRTPIIDALAEHGIHFEKTYCASPRCALVSQSCLFTLCR